MNRRAVILCVVGALMVLIVLGIFVEPTRTVIGYLRGDPFYQGRSASYWNKVLLSNNPSSLQSPELVPFLVGALEDENPRVRVRAAGILGDIGPEAKDAVPALIKASSGSDGKIDEAAIVGLRFADESSKKEYTEYEVKLEFKTGEEAAHYAAAAALRRIDPAAAKQAGLP